MMVYSGCAGLRSAISGGLPGRPSAPGSQKVTQKERDPGGRKCIQKDRTELEYSVSGHLDCCVPKAALQALWGH
jgi:hypothetical protein